MGIFSTYSCLNPEAGNLQAQMCCFNYFMCIHPSNTSCSRRRGWFTEWEAGDRLPERVTSLLLQSTQGPRPASGQEEEAQEVGGETDFLFLEKGPSWASLALTKVIALPGTSLPVSKAISLLQASP